MAEPTVAEMLTSVNEAIKALTDGRVKSYSLGGRLVTYLDLKDLMQLRDQLQAEDATASDPQGGFNFGEFEGMS